MNNGIIFTMSKRSTLLKVNISTDEELGSSMIPTFWLEQKCNNNTSAGQGRWFRQSLPRYQSLWFSTNPIT